MRARDRLSRHLDGRDRAGGGRRGEACSDLRRGRRGGELCEDPGARDTACRPGDARRRGRSHETGDRLGERMPDRGGNHQDSHGLEAEPQLAPSSEEQRFHRRAGETEHVPDLAGAETEDVVQDDSLALALGECCERTPHDRIGDGFGRRTREVRHLFKHRRVFVQRCLHPNSDAPATLVPDDRREPRSLVPRRTATQQGTVGRQERGLEGVLGLVTVAQEHHAEPVEGAPVLRVETGDMSPVLPRGARIAAVREGAHRRISRRRGRRRSRIRSRHRGHRLQARSCRWSPPLW